MNEKAFIDAFLQANCDYVLQKFQDKKMLTVTSKGNPNNLLTEVDLTVQKRFLDAVEKSYPGDLVVGEESGHDAFPANPNVRAWVIDPIDGTYNFVRGLNPAFAISIAFMEQGVAQAAGVAMPLLGHFFSAQAGGGSYCDGRRLVVSQVQHLDQACLEVDFSSAENRRSLLRRAGEVIRGAGQIRSHGSAVVGICQVATGDMDGFLHPGLHPWDFAAAQLIAEEAGAMATRLDGKPLRVFEKKKGVAISNGAIHQELLAAIGR